MRCQRAPAVLLIELGPCSHGIDARFQLDAGFRNRYGGRDVLVQVVAGLDDSGPDLLTQFVLDLVCPPAVELPQEAVVTQNIGDGAVADAVDRGLDFRGVHGNDRNGGVATSGKNVGTAQKADGRRPVLHIDSQIRGLFQLLAIGCRQAAACGDLIAAAMLETIRTDLAAFRLDRESTLAAYADIRAHVFAKRQFLREDQTDPWRRAVGIDFVINDPEAVLGNQIRVLPTDAGIFLDRQRCPQGLDRGLVFAAAGHRAAHKFKRQGALRCADRPQIGIDRG